MDEERLVQLVKDITAPMLEFRSKDPKGYDKWCDAIEYRLATEFNMPEVYKKHG